MTRLVDLWRRFRRFAPAASLALLAAGLAVTLHTGVEEWGAWTRAGEPVPPGPPIVYAFGELAQYRVGTSPGEIKGEIDDLLPMAKRLARDARVASRARAVGPYVSGEAAAELAAIATWTETRRPEPRADGAPLQVKYIYVGPKGMTSHLYTRQALLHAEATGTLGQAGLAILDDLRQRHGFPGPVSEPFSLAFWGWLAATFLVGSPGLVLVGRPVIGRLLARWWARPPKGLDAPIGGPVLIVVSRLYPERLDALRARYRDEPGVQLQMDRRWGERRFRQRAYYPERRRGDRRQQSFSPETLRRHPYVVIPRTGDVAALEPVG